MPNLMIAKFDTQFAAASAEGKLLSRGLPHAHVTISVDESVGNSAASSSAPTSVVSSISHQGRREHRKVSELRSPSRLPEPAQMGHAVVTVELDEEMTADEVRHLMALVGATSIELSNRKAPIENSSMFPEHGASSSVDVERAICATRGGEALGPHSRH
ncbi:hypothetical protein [Dyella choica]|uniref:Uncharacterized protein n=1 Tax=Dyella choica TaxID=1927959 RepID=A0A432MAC0_9GAMM|nr:hypothetical protein [Dyella choica]RUL78366.1 hypothetical protein EKH80_05960 [Dyella choica]